jgi:NAD(P)-dependent dehydrogenase (short-subunit alcohol dehydrogenase family)
MPKTVLITGASAGIGRATSDYFHQQGWQVVATMRSPVKSNANTWFPESERFLALELDVTDLQSIQNAIAATLAKFGRIDCVVNNAGYGLVGAFEATTAADVERQFNTNVFGLMSVIREILPLFRQQSEGTVINLSSVGGQVTFPFYSCYHSTKWAVEGFSESLQFELRPFNIKVKLVEPGPIKTEFYDRSQDLAKKDGLTAYDSLLARTFPRLQSAGANAPGPEVVARTIFLAATDNSWKMRYPVNASQLLWLRKLTPEWLFRLIVGRTLMH